jgi:putative sigma-54 modulation protein
MALTVRPKNFKLNSNTETQIRKRIDRVTHHLDNVDQSEVLLSQEPTRLNAQRMQHVVQVTMRTKNNTLIRAEVANADLLAAVDEAVAKLERQIERHKGRYYQRKKGKQGLGKSSAQVLNTLAAEETTGTAPADSIPDVTSNGALEDEELGEIVRVKRFDVRAMYPEEAIEQMELLGHSFYVFMNAGEDEINILYRRNDGNYGLLQPQPS